MEDKILFTEVIKQLYEVNQKLIDKKISVEVARQIASNTQTIINAAKVSVELMKVSGIKDNPFFQLQIPQMTPEVKAILSVSNNTVPKMAEKIIAKDIDVPTKGKNDRDKFLKKFSEKVKEELHEEYVPQCSDCKSEKFCNENSPKCPVDSTPYFQKKK